MPTFSHNHYPNYVVEACNDGWWIIDDDVDDGDDFDDVDDDDEVGISFVYPFTQHYCLALYKIFSQTSWNVKWN